MKTKKYIEKLAKNLENRKPVKGLLNRIFEEAGAAVVQQDYIEEILNQVIRYQKLYDREKSLSERLQLPYHLEPRHKNLIKKETEKLLSSVEKLLRPIPVADNTNEGKQKISESILETIYDSENPCDIPTGFEIKGVGVFDIDLIHERKNQTINIILNLTLENNEVELNMGDFYFDRNDNRKFTFKIENKEFIEAIDDLIELQSQNLKKVRQSEIADVVRNFFNENNISFEENRAITTSTIYFLANGKKIRVADHVKVSNPSKMFMTSDPFFMERYCRAQERETPHFDFVAGKYPNGREYFENELRRIFG